ncbi:LysR family transcriptional regulator [Shewanella sp. SG41-4]|uniref:helix-turn-helix domain-containing protein n=1 Tax=Shewanella sp. SG41-4 TaxID=2760976 RepID=UPI0016037C8F|nr:LysR family transcriptional regulator [Shewanella sp. SG41-4]
MREKYIRESYGKFNYHHLQYFHTIATYGSIVQASKVMHITPQTLSAQLNLLKVQLGH